MGPLVGRQRDGGGCLGFHEDHVQAGAIIDDEGAPVLVDPHAEVHPQARGRPHQVAHGIHHRAFQHDLIGTRNRVDRAGPGLEGKEAQLLGFMYKAGHRPRGRLAVQIERAPLDRGLALERIGHAGAGRAMDQLGPVRQVIVVGIKPLVLFEGEHVTRAVIEGRQDGWIPEPVPIGCICTEGEDVSAPVVLVDETDV